jgi:hypothetical protein
VKVASFVIYPNRQKTLLKKSILVAQRTCIAGETQQPKPVFSCGDSSLGAVQFISFHFMHLFPYLLHVRSRASSVGMKTVYELDGLGLFSDKDRKFFSAPQREVQFRDPPFPQSSEVKRSGHEADNSPPSSAWVSNGGAKIPPSHKP